MPDLRIKTAKENGDLPKEQKKLYLFPVGHDIYKFTLGDALKNTAVIKKYNEQYQKEFGVPSIFEKGYNVK
tara:strand:- start:192 stop:404 length:213 start_codon:yes stop_codon:yes gene_type:complete